MVQLAEMISELRRERETATAAAKDATLRFRIGADELEVMLVIGREGGAGANVRFWVLEIGGDAQATLSSTQRIDLG